MSNLKTARHTLEAELQHVEQGIAFYQAKAAALEAALAHLDQAESGITSQAPRRQSTARRRDASQAPARPARARKAGTIKADSSLPRMTRAYWLDFIGQEPRTAADIINAAVASFEQPLDAVQTRKMKQRAAQALAALLATKQIRDVGTGRQRRYFLSLGKSSSSEKSGTRDKAAAAGSGTILH